MKRCLILLLMLFCTTVFAHTIRWHVGDSVYQTTTCNSGDNITPPTAPTKYGYTFKEWNRFRSIEYLESTGTQYIDTGLILDYRYSVEATVKLINVKSGQSVLGARNSGSIGTGATLGFTSERYLAIDWFSGTRYSPNIKMELDINYKIKIQDNVFSLTNMDTGNVITTNTFNGYMSSQYKLFIFVLNNGGTPSVSNNTLRIKHVAIKDQNGVLVRDFIPVLDFDGTPCMYDKVENKFYYNQGTGDFIAGPVLQ